jgi:hypothetical protein
VPGEKQHVPVSLFGTELDAIVPGVPDPDVDVSVLPKFAFFTVRVY